MKEYYSILHKFAFFIVTNSLDFYDKKIFNYKD